jgi:hypothetical protein
MLSGTASAAVITGNPLNDGWTFLGNSLSTGVFIRGSAANFDVYATSFQLAAASPLITSFPGTGWMASDTIVGIGATIAPITSTNATVFAKFGSSSALFSPDSNGRLLAPNDGLGSFTAGHGGLGSIQLDSGTIGSPGSLKASGAINNGGTFSVFTNTARYNGTSSVPVPQSDIGRLAYQWNNVANGLGGVEALLNVSLLSRLGYSDAPAVGNKFDLNVSLVGGGSTDAFGVIPAAVPEPSSFVLLASAAIPALYKWRKRQNAIT